MNTFSDPRDIKESEFQALDNVSTDENARLRLSGGFERSEITGEDEYGEFNIGRPGAQIASISSDYKTVSIENQDFALNSAGEEPTGWETEKGDGTNEGWILGSAGSLSTTYVSKPVKILMVQLLLQVL